MRGNAAKRVGKVMDHFVFLCQECHGDLRQTTAHFAGSTIWQCAQCGLTYIYTLAGWGQLPQGR